MLSDISLLSQENIVSTVLSEYDYSALSSQRLKKHSCIWNIQHILSSMPLKCRCCFFAFTVKLSQQAFKYQQVNTMWNCGNKTNTSSFIKTYYLFSLRWLLKYSSLFSFFESFLARNDCFDVSKLYESPEGVRASTSEGWEIGCSQIDCNGKRSVGSPFHFKLHMKQRHPQRKANSWIQGGGDASLRLTVCLPPIKINLMHLC